MIKQTTVEYPNNYHKIQKTNFIHTIFIHYIYNNTINIYLLYLFTITIHMTNPVITAITVLYLRIGCKNGFRVPSLPVLLVDLPVPVVPNNLFISTEGAAGVVEVECSACRPASLIARRSSSSALLNNGHLAVESGHIYMYIYLYRVRRAGIA